MDISDIPLFFLVIIVLIITGVVLARGFRKESFTGGKRRRHKKVRGGAPNPVKIDKALILCHNRIVTGSVTTNNKAVINLTDHWWGIGQFNAALNDALGGFDIVEGPMVVDTVDLHPGGTFTADAFGAEFIDKHRDNPQAMYDLVLVPDCYGRWAALQSSTQVDINTNKTIYASDGKGGNLLDASGWPQPQVKTPEERDTDLKQMLQMALAISQTVRVNGLIVYARLEPMNGSAPCTLYGVRYENIHDALCQILAKYNFTASIKDFPGGPNHKIIVAQRVK